MTIFQKFCAIRSNNTLGMATFLLEARAVRGKCQNVIKCDDFHILILLVKRHGSVL